MDEEDKKKDEPTAEPTEEQNEPPKPEEKPVEHENDFEKQFEELKAAYDERERKLREQYEKEIATQKAINISLIKGEGKDPAPKEQTKAEKFLNGVNARRSQKYI